MKLRVWLLFWLVKDANAEVGYELSHDNSSPFIIPNHQFISYTSIWLSINSKQMNSSSQHKILGAAEFKYSVSTTIEESPCYSYINASGIKLMCTLECRRGKRGLDEVPFGFQCKKKMIIIITANFMLEIRNDFWTLRVISLVNRMKAGVILFFKSWCFENFVIIKVIAECNSGTLQKIPWPLTSLMHIALDTCNCQRFGKNSKCFL